MSLRIRAYARTDNAGRRYIYSESAGAEVSRSTLYGSNVVKSLGCTLLPLLFDPSDTEVEGEDLERLEHEIETVLQNKEVVIRATECDPEHFDDDFGAIAKAVQLAKQVQGGVDVL